jgi:hypothetical protein
MRERLRQVALDVGMGLLWAAMLAAVVLFSSGASEFIYIDF